MVSSNVDLHQMQRNFDTVSVSEISVGMKHQFNLPQKLQQDVISVLDNLKLHQQDPVKCCSHISKLWSICSTSKDYLQSIITLLGESDFAECALCMLKRLKANGYFSEGFKILGNFNLWNTTKGILDCLCLFSKHSLEFGMKLINAGLPALLVGNMELYNSSDGFRANDSKPLYIINATICLVKNLAFKATEQKRILRKYFILNLKHFQTFQRLDVFAIVGIISVSNRVDFASQKDTETSNMVRTLANWINQYIGNLNDPRHENDFFTISDMITAYSYLATYCKPNAFCDTRILSTFLKLLESNSMADRFQLMTIVWTLCFHEEFEKMITGDKLLKTIRRSEENEMESIEVRYPISGLLTLLRKRYIPRSVSFDACQSADSGAFIVFHKNDTEIVRILSRKLKEDHLSIIFNTEDQNDRKYFQSLVSCIRKAFCLLICVSEHTELDLESRTALYCAEKLGRKVVAVIVQREFELNGWVAEKLQPLNFFQFTRESDIVRGLSSILLSISIEFSDTRRNSGNFDNSFRRSVSSVLSNSSDVSTEHVENAFGTQSTLKALSKLSVSSSTSSELPSPNSAGIEPNTSSSVFFMIYREPLTMPDRFATMTTKDVIRWVKNLGAKIDIRNFRGIDGPKLWELVLAFKSCNESNKTPYDSLVERFRLDKDQKLKFTEALLRLG